MAKYKIYSSDGVVVAISSFAQKPVRGIAKCDPEDTFSLDSGKELAIARCDNKIAEKRVKLAKKKLEKATVAYEEAMSNFNLMTRYYCEAVQKLEESEQTLTEILTKL